MTIEKIENFIFKDRYLESKKQEERESIICLSKNNLIFFRTLPLFLLSLSFVSLSSFFLYLSLGISFSIFSFLSLSFSTFLFLYPSLSLSVHPSFLSSSALPFFSLIESLFLLLSLFLSPTLFLFLQHISIGSITSKKLAAACVTASTSLIAICSLVKKSRATQDVVINETEYVNNKTHFLSRHTGLDFRDKLIIIKRY